MNRQRSEKRVSQNIVELIEKVLALRYLRGLSDEKREQLRHDLDFIRRTLVEQRPPRIAVVGSAEVELSALLTAIAGRNVDGDLDVKEYLGRQRWYDYEIRDSVLELLDLRAEEGEEPGLKALERQPPDVVLFAWSYRDDSLPETSDPSIDVLERVVGEVQSIEGEAPPLVAVIDNAHLPEDVTPAHAERVLRSALRDSSVPNAQFRVVQRQNIRDFVAEIVELTPMEARLRLARIVQTPGSKRRLARLIIRSSAGIAATVATLPLPIADILPITSVQILMIATIGHLSGRHFRLKTDGEFAAAIGLNVGAGYALREIARAIVQFIPVAGSVISSGIAAGATYALGNAAVEYFLESET